MEHHAPHRSSVFEGYYSKFDLPSGAHLALLVCKVKGAKVRPNMVSFSYVPQDASKTYQKEVWADDLQMVTFGSTLSRDYSFGLEVPGIGYARWYGDGTRTEYSFEHPDFSFHGKSTSKKPWSSDTNTPEALLVNLPLPLHWHVQSLSSECDFDMDLPGYDLPVADQSGRAIVHQEKNWAQSFPSAHMWLQARDGDRGFCCAGGQILGLEAFLLGYRSKDLNIDFRPPFAVRTPMLGLGPFMSYRTDWADRSFRLSVQNFWQKLVVKASAPKGTFFSLSSPFPKGHHENFVSQSFQAKFDVKIYESIGWLGGLLGNWKLVREDAFDGASLEFGGAYYPLAGSKERYH